MDISDIFDKNPGDPILAGDWNKLALAVQEHRLWTENPVAKGSLSFKDANNQVYPGGWIGMANNIDGATQWLHIGGIEEPSGGDRKIGHFADRTPFHKWEIRE